MPRRKIPISLITDPRARALTFAKRKEGLKKKAHELATLCGVPVAVVCVGADGGAPYVWSSEEGVIERYQALPSEQRSEHTHKKYMEAELGKENAKLARLREGGSNALAPWDEAVNEMTLGNLQQLLNSVDAALKATRERKQSLQAMNHGNTDDGELGLVPQGASEPCNAIRPAGYSVPWDGSNCVDMDGYQMQCSVDAFLEATPALTEELEMPGNVNVVHDQLDLAIWGTPEPCNGIMPAGYSVPWDGSNCVDMDAYQMQCSVDAFPEATNAWMQEMEMPDQLDPVTCFYSNFVDMDGHQMQCSANEYSSFDCRQPCSLSIPADEQLFFVNDGPADDLHAGLEDTQLQLWAW